MVVLEVLDNTAYGQPVHVHIRNRHKDRNLHHLAVDMLLLVDNFRNDNTTIAGREDKLVVVNLHTARLTEEGSNEEPEDKQQSSHKPDEACPTVDKEVGKEPDGKTADARNAYNSVTLFVNLHIV